MKTMFSKRKGSGIILLITIFATFIPISMFASALNASGMISDSVEYRSGDVAVLAQSQVQKENLKDQYRAGLKYSLNEQAFESGSSNTWRNLPDISSIRSSFIQRAQQDLNSRFSSSSLGCRLDDVSVDRDGEGSYTVLTSGNSISCSQSHASVTNYFNEDVQLDHPENRYLKLADYAIRISERFEEEVPSKIEGTASDTGACGEPASSVRENAESEAKDNAVEGLSYGSSAVSAAEDVDSTSVDESTRYEGSWSTTDTTPGENRCCEEKGQVTDGEGNRNCVEWDDYHSAESKFSVDTAVLDLTITDTENELVYSGGEENLDYSAEYFYSLD